MSSDFSVRPPGAPPAKDFSRTPSGARGAVAVQVTAANSVTATGQSQTFANDTPGRDRGREAALDRAVAELVYKAASPAVGQSPRQIAEDLTSKVRAYRRAQQSGRAKRDQSPDQNTDREA